MRDLFGCVAGLRVGWRKGGGCELVYFLSISFHIDLLLLACASYIQHKLITDSLITSLLSFIAAQLYQLSFPPPLSRCSTYSYYFLIIAYYTEYSLGLVVLGP